MAATTEAVARAICAACDENPDHSGDAGGNAYRWQDYAPAAEAAIAAMDSEINEQCRLLGMSGEREAKHLAQIERLRSALERCEHETTSLRVWNGDEWSYSPYQAGRIAKIARDALNASGAGGV